MVHSLSPLTCLTLEKGMIAVNTVRGVIIILGRIDTEVLCAA
jgi:hypothetical protein